MPSSSLRVVTAQWILLLCAPLLLAQLSPSKPRIGASSNAIEIETPVDGRILFGDEDIVAKVRDLVAQLRAEESRDARALANRTDLIGRALAARSFGNELRSDVSKFNEYQADSISRARRVAERHSVCLVLWISVSSCSLLCRTVRVSLSVQ